MGKSRKKPSTSDDPNARIWKKVMKDVQPLISDLFPEAGETDYDMTHFYHSADPAPPSPVAKPAAIVNPPPKNAPPPVLSHGDIHKLDKRTGQKFKDGRMGIEAKLDLHGKTEAQAYGALREFIEVSAERGLRCVLVVTGKGRLSEGGVGVIRRAAPNWLNEPDMRALVLSFSHARPKDGGEGALYILLKRRRT